MLSPTAGEAGLKLNSAVGGRVATVIILVSVSVFITSSVLVTVSETVYVPAVANVCATDASVATAPLMFHWVLAIGKRSGVVDVEVNVTGTPEVGFALTSNEAVGAADAGAARSAISVMDAINARALRADVLDN